MNLRLGNKYLADTEPWKVAKNDLDRTASILNVSLQICANLAIAFAPFLPFSVEKLNNILNVAALDSALAWDELGKDEILPVGHKLNKAELLFAKIEDEQVEAQIAKLNATKVANEAAAAEKSAQEEPTIAPAKAECTLMSFPGYGYPHCYRS